MGEVYRARDTRLDRTVAVKVLLADLPLNADSTDRFEREARAIASLNHPHICTLHDVGHENGIDFLVMELLDGESLADLVSKGPLATAVVLRYAIQIADALARAHGHGIIHRDLKPGNVMITKVGAKLLDFGLAKSRAPMESASALDAMTRTHPLTARGTILGTFQYMSPEQLEGRDADARSDIFALGAVIYEMATGKAAFGGKTPASVIASILTTEPAPVSTLAPASPPALDRLVRHCLAKDPGDRWQTAHDVRLQLEAIRDQSGETVAPPAAAPSRRFERAGWALAVSLGLIGGILIGVAYIGHPEVRQPAKYFVSPPGDIRFDFAVLSPNGRMLAFVGVSSRNVASLWTKRIDALEAQPLAGTEGIRPGGAAMAGTVFWSPDSQSIAFFAQSSLKVVDAGGGPPQTLCAAPGQNSGTWSTDGTILFGMAEASGSNGLYRIPAAGGASERLELTDEAGKRIVGGFWPRFLPDGRHFLFLGRTGTSPARSLRAGTLGSPATTSIMPLDSRVEYAPPGYLLWVREGTLLAQPFDASSRRLSGKPSPIGQDVRYFEGTGNANFSTSQNGLLIYERQQSQLVQMIRVDRQGREVESYGEPAEISSGRLSPSGTQFAMSVTNLRTQNGDLWIKDLARNVSMRLTSSNGSAFNPVWSPDGQRVVFAADWDSVPHLFVQAIEATHESVLRPPTGNVQIPTDWSPDGGFILYMERDPANDFDVWALPTAGDRKPIPLANTKFFEGSAVFSPDGRWIAYVSDEAGSPEVYIQPFQRPGERRRISIGGGVEPQWRRDGKELFYESAGTLMAVQVTPGDQLRTGTPAALFNIPNVDTGYDVFPDGQHFAKGRSVRSDDRRLPIVVVNWAQGLSK